MAFERLLRAHGLNVDDIEADDRSRADRLVFNLKEPAPCPECGGTGWYVGLKAREKCRICG